MHYSHLVTVDIPPITPDPATDKLIDEAIEKMLTEKDKRNNDNFMLNIHLEELFGLRNPFAREVHKQISSVMEPYSECTEDSDYLEFEDHTEELKDDYENNSIDCIKLPEGRIVSIHNPRVFNKFIIGEDGKVYQKDFGQLKHPKRSKKAKKMTAYKDYPYKKLFKTFAEFAEQERYFDYNEEYGGYGYLFNPDAFFDWYQIGGRWPKTFLVKDTCEEYSIGERSWCNKTEQYKAPEGYMWVCAARKKDIEWQVMFDWNMEQKTKFYNELLECFGKGSCPKEWCAQITENGIISWGETLYVKGETLDEFLTRHKVTADYPYQIFPYGYLNGYEYSTSESFESINGQYKIIEDENWYQKIKDLFDNADDEKVFVGVDCHI